MPPKLKSYLCRNNPECPRATGDSFSSSNALFQHEKKYCKYTTQGARKEMSTEKRGRGRPMKNITNQETSDEPIGKVARVDKTSDALNKKDKFKNELEDYIPKITMRVKTGGLLIHKIDDALENFFVLVDKDDYRKLDSAQNELQDYDTELLEFRKLRDLYERSPTTCCDLPVEMQEELQSLLDKLKESNLTSDLVTATRTSCEVKKIASIRAEEEGLNKLEKEKEAEIQSLKDEFDKKLAALNDEITAAKTKTATTKTNIEAQYSKFQSGLRFIDLKMSDVAIRDKIFCVIDDFVGRKKK